MEGIKTLGETADLINGIISDAHRDEDRSIENLTKYRKQVIAQIKQYALLACEEQRSICGDYLVLNEPGGICFRDELKTIMRNAPEPKLK